VAIGDQIFSTALRIHAAIYERTDGRIGHRLLGVPTLMMRTTGRRSGKTRTNSLVYARDGERYLVVPSKGGAPTAPAWLHNLRADPDVEIQIGRERRPARAAIVTREDADFERLWRAVNDNNADRYDAYQARTTRQIPVVALTPSGPPASA
jgi:deazaflavin-dependent oxidoreductase (nitroreductase family)